MSTVQHACRSRRSTCWRDRATRIASADRSWLEASSGRSRGPDTESGISAAPSAGACGRLGCLSRPARFSWATGKRQYHYPLQRYGDWGIDRGRESDRCSTIDADPDNARGSKCWDHEQLSCYGQTAVNRCSKKLGYPKVAYVIDFLARPAGFEPMTPCFVGVNTSHYALLINAL